MHGWCWAYCYIHAPMGLCSNRGCTVMQSSSNHTYLCGYAAWELCSCWVANAIIGMVHILPLVNGNCLWGFEVECPYCVLAIYSGWSCTWINNFPRLFSSCPAYYICRRTCLRRRFSSRLFLSYLMQRYVKLVFGVRLLLTCLGRCNWSCTLYNSMLMEFIDVVIVMKVL